MIRIRSVAKSWRGPPVLRGVDLDIRPGRVTALLGPNGSGKTTLIKMLLGLVRPDAGTIEIDGQRLDGGCAYRHRIGYMPQAACFPENLTGREILAMLEGLRSTATPDHELLAAFMLEPELDKPVRELSGGNRQKLSAAAAFLFDPALVILDEPTAGLDPIAAGTLKDRIRRERARGRTLILSSHVLSEVEQLADDVVLLLDGDALWAGGLADLRATTRESSLERSVASLMVQRHRGEAAA